MPKNSLDWMAMGLLLFIFGGIIGAFILYLRTSYRKGGWKRVKADFMPAAGVLLLWAAERLLENYGIQRFVTAARHGFR